MPANRSAGSAVRRHKREHRSDIRAISDRAGSPPSGSKETFWLTNIIPGVIQNNPSLAENIYVRLYSYDEESEETTSLGGGLGTRFTSIRRQDLSSALYGLMSRFSLFLERDSVRAARIAIRATEREVFRERCKDEHKEYEKIRFNFRGRIVTYQADHSEIWDGASSRDLTSLNLLDVALEFASTASKQVRGDMIAETCQFASLGVSWRRLMLRAKLHPEALYSEVKELLFIPTFISAPEVTVDVGEILKAAYERGLVSRSDAERIERAIVQIARTKFIRRYERAVTIQQRLVGCLPKDSITNPTLLEKINLWGTGNPRANKPFYEASFGAVAPDLHEEYRSAGVDPDSKPNAEATAATSKVTPPRNRTEIIRAIDVEINRLQQARALLTDQTVPLKRDVPSSSGRRKVSAEGRARMAASQKARNR
jgi:hypothetical protein